MKIAQLTIGFIGLGEMGRRLARRLIDGGFHVTVYDRSPQRMRELVDLGATAADSVRTLGANSDVIMSCVTNDYAVLEIYSGAAGALAAAKPGSIVVEMSTVLPETSKRLSELGRERNIEVLDVPISGSTPAAEEGSLILFGGGTAETFERCEPIFKALSRRHYYVGLNGAGSAMKLVVNTLLGVGMQAIAEAAALGERIGLDRKRMLEVLAQTAVVAPAHQGKLPRAARDDYSPQFPLKLMQKDFRLILGLANDHRVPMPATTAASIVNRTSAERGEFDFSFVMEEMRRRTDSERRESSPEELDAERLSPAAGSTRG